MALMTVLAACKKQKGDTGPAGPAGTNGTNGNANVKLFTYGKDSITSSLYYFDLVWPAGEVTANMIDSSAVLVYHKTYGLWYSSPGFGWSGQYQFRVFTDSYSITMSALNPDGTIFSGSKYVFDKFRVLVIPSSDYKGSRKKPVDFNNYYETMGYYHLPLE